MQQQAVVICGHVLSAGMAASTSEKKLPAMGLAPIHRSPAGASSRPANSCSERSFPKGSPSFRGRLAAGDQWDAKGRNDLDNQHAPFPRAASLAASPSASLSSRSGFDKGASPGQLL